MKFFLHFFSVLFSVFLLSGCQLNSPETEKDNQSLTDKIWYWVETYDNNDLEIKPKKEGVFSAMFHGDGQVSFGTDCNSAGGSYVVEKNRLSFGSIHQTKKYCEGSQENEFLSYFSEVQNYFITEDGQLVLDLKFDTGGIIFR